MADAVPSDVASSNAAPARASVWRRRVWRLGRIGFGVYFGLIVVGWSLQSCMMFPGHATQGTKLAVVPPGRDYELLELRAADGTPVVAVFGKALSSDGEILSDAGDRPTILFFYGNGMCAADFMGEFRKFRKLGLNVMVPDYAGYGMSGGKPSEKSFYATADACWEHLISRQDIDKSKIVAAGWSIGAAVAVDLASRKPAAGLVLFSAFTSMADMARNLLPFLPTSLLISHKFDSLRKIREIDIPTLIVHGRGDQIIPFGMSERLAQAAKGPVTVLWVDTDHNDLFDLASDQVYPALQTFMRQIASRP